MKTFSRSCAVPVVLAVVFAPAVLTTRASSSTNYTITPATLDCGGGRILVGSVHYVIDATIGAVAGKSTAGEPLHLVKAGYAGQLYDEVALIASAAPLSLDEAGTRQLNATAQLDDETFLLLDPATVDWSVVSGPVRSISPTGIATADVVFEDSAARVQGARHGRSDVLDLTILDVDVDNFGLYAGDQLDDVWQVQFFGLDNLLAASTRDPDGDGQDNLFEFTAGVSPVDPLDRFRLTIRSVAGTPNRVDLVFRPRFADRTYTVFSSTDLASGAWTPLSGPPPTTDNGLERTVTDTNVTGARKFYRVRIDRP